MKKIRMIIFLVLMLQCSQLGENKYSEGSIVTCMILTFLNLFLAKGFLSCLLVNVYKQSDFLFEMENKFSLYLCFQSIHRIA